MSVVKPYEGRYIARVIGMDVTKDIHIHGSMSSGLEVYMSNGTETLKIGLNSFTCGDGDKVDRYRIERIIDGPGCHAVERGIISEGELHRD